jgi:DNA-binding transcriptional LysR family regulator
MITFDSELLRTLVAIADAGGFARAAARRHLTQSTVSQHMKRLEDQVGRPLFAPAGRRRAPTEAGELLLGYARKILSLHDAAGLALAEGAAAGVVRIGATQDFAEAHLPAVLRAFSRAHPRVRMEARVGQSQELRALVSDAALDAAIVFAEPSAGPGVLLGRERAAWLAAPDFAAPPPADPWPLALFEPPCVFRDAALRALDARQIPWRIAYSSPSLAGIRAAVRAGLAVTARLARDARNGLRALGAKDGLPRLGGFQVALVTSPETPSPAVSAVVALLRARKGEAGR